MAAWQDFLSELKVNPDAHLLQVLLSVQLSQPKLQDSQLCIVASRYSPVPQEAQLALPVPLSTAQVRQPKEAQVTHDFPLIAGTMELSAEQFTQMALPELTPHPKQLLTVKLVHESHLL
jgi:hypothetical protein